MAKQYTGVDIPLKAYDDMSSGIYHFVVMNGDDTADVCSGATDVVVGVLQHGGTTGQGCSVRITGHTKIELGETITAGQLVGTSTTGTADTVVAGTDTTIYVAGICTVGGSSGEIGEMILLPRGRAQ